ncbi:cilia- and flagella-associated protein 91-like isoform X2 [Zootermopsis nevadensis]|nr:cilia- and flagella-associated protein 91-like isoform X2 [Zootermopsis nevadensis]
MGTKVKILNSEKSKYRPSRPFDYIYDPDYVVSGHCDFQKCIAESFKTQAEFELCPLYTTMFSDAYSRNMMVLKQLNHLPPWFDRCWEHHHRAVTKTRKKPLDVDGVDRYHFFSRPLDPILQPAETIMTFSSVVTEGGRESFEESVPGIQNRSTQTDYRESETQTTPWAPPVFTHCTSTPEVLTLANLSWDHGLPAGMHEVETIEHTRIKRAWENAMPASWDPKYIKKMINIIDAMDRDEWLFREKEIQTIHNMRLDLAWQLIQKSQLEEAHKLNIRLQHYWIAKQQEKTIKIQKIRLDHNRELRKLLLRHKGIDMKYHKGSIVEKYRDHKSELYGPQMRSGEHPKHCHELISVHSRFLTHPKGLEILETMSNLPQPSHHMRKPAVQNYELCARETRWTEAVLQQLHQDLKDIHMKGVGESQHMEFTLIPIPKAPGTGSMSDSEEEVYLTTEYNQGACNSDTE